MNTTNKDGNKDLVSRTAKRLTDLGFIAIPRGQKIFVAEVDDSEDGDGEKALGTIIVNGPRDFVIPARVQRAIDAAKAR